MLLFIRVLGIFKFAANLRGKPSFLEPRLRVFICFLASFKLKKLITTDNFDVIFVAIWGIIWKLCKVDDSCGDFLLQFWAVFGHTLNQRALDRSIFNFVFLSNVDNYSNKILLLLHDWNVMTYILMRNFISVPSCHSMARTNLKKK